jgi:CubicO group peptidase (beta-lactamase class C family)
VTDTTPRDVGLDEEAWHGLVERARVEVDTGLLPSCQLALARDGKVVAVTLGAATPESRYTIYSATKAVVASAMWILIGDGAIDPARRVAEYVPEFGTNGKDVITVEQVMLHTSGFPYAPFDPLDWDDRDARLARFGRWHCTWEPGTRFEYHATSAHWVLAELIERAAGRDFRAFLRTEVLEPLGLTRLRLGVPIEEQGDVLEVLKVGEPATRDELMAAIGVPELPVTDVTPEFLLSLNRPAARAVGVPGGGAVSTAADVVRFYQALLHNSTGDRPTGDRSTGIWKAEVLEDAKTNVRNRFPDWFGTPANRTLGLVLAGDDGKSNLRGMGRTVSPGTFGHNGAGGQIAWSDPATGVSFCYLTNALDQHPIREARRTTAIASRAAVCASGRGS